MSENSKERYVPDIVLSQERREEVFRYTFDYRHKLPPDVRNNFDRMLRLAVRVPGWRKANEAPIPLLASAFLRSANKNEAILKDLVSFWMVCQSPLVSAVTEFLDRQAEAGATWQEYCTGFPGSWTRQGIETATNYFLAEYPSFARQDVSLALCKVKVGISPMITDIVVKGENNASERAVSGETSVDEWRVFLEPWLALNSEAREWSRIDLFVSVLRGLEEQHRSIQNSLQTLRVGVANLITSHADTLDLFEIGYKNWDVSCCPANNVIEATDHVDVLFRQITEYLRLEALVGGSLAEKKTRRRQLDDIEETVTNEGNIVSGYLLRGEPGPNAPTQNDKLTASENGYDHSQPDAVGSTSETHELDLIDRDQDAAFHQAKTAVSSTIVLFESIEPQLISENNFPSKILSDDVVSQQSIPMIAAAITTVASTELAVLDNARITDNRDQTKSPHEDEILSQFLEVNDLEGAYWYARSHEALGYQSSVPSWLVAAVVEARRLGSGADGAELISITRNHQPPTDEASLHLLGLSAAICPSLILPEAGASAWLTTSGHTTSLNSLVDALIDFTRLSRPLQPNDFDGLLNVTDIKLAIEQNLDEAKRWFENARQRRFVIKHATDVWKQLIDNDVNSILDPVISRRLPQIEETRKHLSLFERPDELIHNVCRRVHDKRSLDIVGIVRNQMMNDLKEAARIARHWIFLAERQSDIQEKGDWFYTQVFNLREKIQQVLPHTFSELSQLIDTDNRLAASGLCLQDALVQLSSILKIPTSRTLRPLSMYSTSDRESHVDALRYRLLWLPQLRLQDNGQPDAESLKSVAGILEDSLKPSEEVLSVASIIDAWSERQDYRFLERFLEPYANSSKYEELHSHIQQQLAGNRRLLKSEVDGTDIAIQKALTDGVTNDDEVAEFKSVTERIDIDSVFLFPPLRSRLHDVRVKLEQATLRHIQTQRILWSELERDLQEKVAPDLWIRITAFIYEALDKKDPRIVDECLSDLRAARDQGKELDENLYGSVDKQFELEQFLQVREELFKWLEDEPPARIVQVLSQGSTSANIAFGKVPEMRRKEAVAAYERWRELKQRGSSVRAPEEQIIPLLEFLGFSRREMDERSFVVNKVEGNLLHVRVALSSSDLARPIPQFGQSVEWFDVVCFWDRPGVGIMRGRLNELGLAGRSVIVLYLGRITRREWVGLVDLRRLSREKDLALLVLDETLLLFLAGQRDVRLPVFLRCALPQTAIFPYTPDRAGAVPPEMFFGRREMIRSLQDMNGTCLVYGGRQLGKSALLSHVQREFHRPQDNQYAWVEYIKMLGPASKADLLPETLWHRLREQFVRHRLLKATNAEKTETIYRQLKDALLHSPRTRVLVLCDEADNFLDGDAQTNFRVVTELRRLMLETEHRFKIVFTGLHHVQRFDKIANQPLAHFGSPVLVGPLSPTDARLLIVEPLEAIGFRLDERTILRILSYTNYHPGLIQKFCHALLQRMYSPGVSGSAPTTISQEDVESVYINPEVRRFIRERFDLTLALDERYQAITWSLVVEQMLDRLSYAKAFRTREILGIARSYWPQGFEDMQLGQLQVLLDEMCDLGVLVCRDNESYYLRSPNLVRLMGTNEDIESRLEELAQMQPHREDLDSRHAALDVGSRPKRFSPLTYGQERCINPDGSAVSLIFASRALGLEALEQAVRRTLDREDRGRQSELQIIPNNITGEEQTTSWLMSYCGKHQDEKRLLAVQHIDSSTSGIEKRIRASLDYIQNHRLKQSIKIIFLLSPNSAWAWLTLSSQVREELEARLNCITQPKRWNRVGISQRLESIEKMSTIAVTGDIQRATEGWPFLIDTLLDRCGTDSDPRPYIKRISEELSPSTELGVRFRDSLGVQSRSPAETVLHFLYEYGEPLVVEEITPDVLGVDRMTVAQCTAALEFLRIMGCIDIEQGKIHVEPLISRFFVTS